ncbi:hypothetical protein METUNv1_01371 [Methyloversatilis universalis FAM5]|uniref:Uncharacterized protein n=1 Tax=Methyloversatilis universalis (strain ATCC BAA-1314 / DSM 25237 / JCM 13912 / CCUG 52030 / FAM5) TaxID=1000565 RepID=F5RAZ4_METUF|nr:hypothetical protein METUNv1_01371 [Methyloversatilis universalis FAM5]
MGSHQTFSALQKITGFDNEGENDEQEAFEGLVSMGSTHSTLRYLIKRDCGRVYKHGSISPRHPRVRGRIYGEQRS